MITAPRTHLFENEHTRVTKRSLDAYAQVTAALAGSPTINTVYPTGNSLADQLRLIAFDSAGKHLKSLDLGPQSLPAGPLPTLAP